jgi:two-component system cell cycle sensor histidine kinase/response regulator CckA
MRGQDKTKGQLINELNRPRHRIIEESQLEGTRKQTEEALRESENYYRTLLQNLPQKIFLKDKNSVYLSCNENYSRDLKMGPAEITGKTDYDFYPKEFAEKYRADDKRIMESRKSEDIEEKYIQDGMEVIVHTVKTPVKDEQGKIIGILGIFWDITESKHADDELKKYRERLEELVEERTAELRNANEQLRREITERKRAEETLRESEEKYRSILENIQDGYLEVDLAGNFTFVNDVVCRRLGYSREELIGMNNRQYTDETAAKKTFQLFNRVYRTGEPVKSFEVEVIRKDGTSGIYELSVSLIRNLEGKPIGFRSISRDITERKRAEEALQKSEERYRTILESIEDGYYEVDLAGSFTFFNDSMCQIFGYPREELMGMNDRQYTDQETTRKLFQAFNEVYRTRKRSRVFDYEIIRKDGTKRHVETSISLQKDASGKPIGFRGIIRDITDRKRIEEQLFQAEKLRAVGEMASGVAHDFNNALASILGNTQLLLYTAQDEKLKETLKIIEKVAKDSGQTVRRLQDFTRKPVPQELFKVDINSIIKDSIEITKPKWKDEAQSRGIRIEMVSNLGEIPLASGNSSELREVITNMIFNAIEAMPEGGRIEIRTFKKRRDVLIQISDTGIGIGEEEKRKIFEPFFTTKPFTNTGLGLSMSYGIIKRFGGEIEVESKVGQGTTFRIILPIGEDEKEEAVEPQPTKKGIKARILVIDDDEFVRSILSRTLAQADHQVTLAESGEKGVQLFQEGKFDIVLTDLGMPGVSGWEVCRMIKEVSPRTPVGMITGWGDERNRSKMEEYGLDFFVSKPFDLAQILNVVAETMESREG